MYEGSSLYAVMYERLADGVPLVKLIEVDGETFDAAERRFRDGTTRIRTMEDGSDKTPVEFSNDYSINPEDDEFMQISDFVLPETICAAIDSPDSIERYVVNENEDLPKMRALFMGVSQGGSYRVAFQRVKNEQYLRATGVHLFWDSDVMRDVNHPRWFRPTGGAGLTISSSVDCVYDAGNLQFVSHFYAKQVLDLTSYYQEAQKPELEAFVASPSLDFSAIGAFADMADSWERRKVASIRGNHILEQHPVDEIEGAAAQFNIVLQIVDGKIVVPADKKGRKMLLRFLDEDMYRGVLSDEIYQTNSKRRTS